MPSFRWCVAAVLENFTQLISSSFPSAQTGCGSLAFTDAFSSGTESRGCCRLPSPVPAPTAPPPGARHGVIVMQHELH